MDSSVDYDQPMNSDDSPRQEWTESVRQAVADFTRQVSETSQQLANAAERFATDSMRVIDDVSGRAEQSVSRSSEMAAAASAAAEDARSVAESVRSSLSDAAEKVRQETEAMVREAVSKAESAAQSPDLEARLEAISRRADQAVESSERLQNDLDSRLGSVNEQASQAAERVRGELEERFGSLSASSSDATDSLRSEVDTRVAEAVEQARSAMGAAAEIRLSLESRLDETLHRFEESSSAGRSAAEEARKAADEARNAVNEASAHADRAASSSAPAVSATTQEVLERLEADYSLLTRLVQELHSRITSLAAQGSSQPAEAQTPAVEEEAAPIEDLTPTTHWEVPTEPPLDDALTQAVSAAPDTGWQQTSPEPVLEDVQETVEQAVTEPEAAVQAGTSPTGDTIEGRVLISIAPVPDFDRLLSLDGALGRMDGIANVTLADYAKEEVTFRVEIQATTSVEEFRNRLSQSSGTEIEVVSSADGGLSLRLAS